MWYGSPGFNVLGQLKQLHTHTHRERRSTQKSSHAELLTCDRSVNVCWVCWWYIPLFSAVIWDERVVYMISLWIIT